MKKKKETENRKRLEDKLKKLGETEENTERILSSIESYCQLVLQSVKKSKYG